MKFMHFVTGLIFSTNLIAGVGGVAGGSSIYFQSESMYVNVQHNRTVCINDNDEYEAVVYKCVQWRREDGDRVCSKQTKQKIYQPRVSSRSRCVSYSEGDCVESNRYRYTQGRTRIVNIYRGDDSEPYRSEKVTVPRCR